VDVYAGDHNVNNKARTEVRNGINYFIIPSLKSSRLFYKPNDPVTAIKRLFLLPKKNYDVYHLFQPFLQALVPWNYLRRTKKRAVFIYDWDDLWTGGLFQETRNIREAYLKKVTAFIEKSAPGLCDGITVCSDFLAKKTNGLVPLEVIANGFWPKERPAKAEMRKKWRLEDSKFYIGYIGKTAGELDWIMDGLDYLENEGLEDVRLVLVGPEATEVAKYASVQKTKYIHLGQVSPAEASEIASAIDIGLIPLEDSLFNQSRFPIKFFDFLTVGTPVYMSDVGEIALIAKRIDKAIVGPAEKQAWIKSLKDSVTTVITKAFGADVEQELQMYSWSALACKQVEFYEKVMGLKFAKLNGKK
jgi:hypothetical protein